MVSAAKLVTSTEDWHPSYPGGRVRVSLIALVGLLPTGKNVRPKWRVLVSGRGDGNLERDFWDFGEAVERYNGITDGITHKTLIDLGFGQIGWGCDVRED
jgi:hypothetical protein